jgi:death-on-curing protein
VSFPCSNWTWLGIELVLAVHDEQLVDHGGGAGVRDRNLLESALARPEQLACYGTPDAADLAASYGFGISRNHPFVDGNKRTAFVALELFLALNGFELMADDAQCVVSMLKLSSGELPEADFANSIRESIQPRKA